MFQCQQLSTKYPPTLPSPSTLKPDHILPSGVRACTTKLYWHCQDPQSWYKNSFLNITLSQRVLVYPIAFIWSALNLLQDYFYMSQCVCVREIARERESVVCVRVCGGMCARVRVSMRGYFSLNGRVCV